ncbi:MAG: 50S ribosomal protein L6 [Candidatus Micrarchaeota archaeon]|nr:50S ribosomal protein L6 [Candidatus Micrarchaeota archaeon]
MKIIDGAKVSVDRNIVTVSGAKGTLVKNLSHPGLKLSIANGEISAEGELVMVNTAYAHIKNMMNGVISGYSKKIKILYSHFPISMEIKGKLMLIKNFLGEKQPRKAKIMGQTKVESKGQELTISGPSKEEVGQTFANIKSATKIRDRDSRVFQDGFYEVVE